MLWKSYPSILALAHVEHSVTPFQRTLDFDEVFWLGLPVTFRFKISLVYQISSEVTIVVFEDDICFFPRGWLFQIREVFCTTRMHSDVVTNTARPVARAQVKPTSRREGGEVGEKFVDLSNADVSFLLGDMAGTILTYNSPAAPNLKSCLSWFTERLPNAVVGWGESECCLSSTAVMEADTSIGPCVGMSASLDASLILPKSFMYSSWLSSFGSESESSWIIGCGSRCRCGCVLEIPGNCGSDLGMILMLRDGPKGENVAVELAGSTRAERSELALSASEQLEETDAVRISIDV